MCSNRKCRLHAALSSCFQTVFLLLALYDANGADICNMVARCSDCDHTGPIHLIFKTTKTVSIARCRKFQENCLKGIEKGARTACFRE